VLSPTRLGLATLLLSSAGAVAFAAPGGDGVGGAAAAKRDPNPCIQEFTARRLRCPDLRMAPPDPDSMFLSRTRRGRLRLNAENAINSVGTGPAELRGRRAGRYTMAARQAVYRKDGSVRMLETGARLGFKAVPGQYRYWKYIHAAHFQLWRLDDDGHRTKLARVGPKQSYCLRDLQRRNPQLPRSPSSFRYPGCSQDFRIRRVTLGTSVGWSDVYPSSYHEQWIDVTGLRGCFAYVHIADPKNGIYESDERNNAAETIVRLPYLRAGRRGCPARSRPKGADGGPDGGAEAPG
jgi:hypothetical protein